MIVPPSGGMLVGPEKQPGSWLELWSIGGSPAVGMPLYAMGVRLRCLYLLAGGDDPQTLAAAQAAGFRWVDLRLTLERQPLPGRGAAAGGRRSIGRRQEPGCFSGPTSILRHPPRRR